MKLSFLGLGRENPQLELYGKLPLAKDYLRIGCGEGSSRELREWLDRTFGTVREASQQLVLGEPLRFLGQGTREPLQGCIWPSSDAGGLRSFPFTIFVKRRRKPLGADLEDGLAGAEAVWRLIAETRERCLSFSDGRQLLDESRGRDVDVESSGKVVSAHADFDTWLAALWPEELRDGLVSVLERIVELVRGGYDGPYRLPLARDLPLRDQVVGWSESLQSLHALPEGELPTLFFPPRSLAPPPDVASLVVSRRPLTDDQVVWLTTDGEDADLGPADLRRGVEGQGSGSTSPPDAPSSIRESLRSVLADLGPGID